MISWAEIRRFFIVDFPENNARVTMRTASGPGSRFDLAGAALHALGGILSVINMENSILKYGA
jgi:hypothetical protein